MIKTTGKPARIKACAYLRMSTDRQDTSIEIQEKRLLELAEHENYEIVEWYKDEGRSASKDTKSRTDWLKMLGKAPTAQWEVILCYNRSRFSRLDSIEEGEAKQALRTAGKRLHTIFEGRLDWNTSEGRIIDTVHTESANRYSAELGRGTLEGRLNAFLNGKGHGQVCPYGMARRIMDTDGHIIDIPRVKNFLRPKAWTQTFVPGAPKEVETVRWVFNTFIEKDVGYRWLSLQLNAKKLPAPSGGKWRGPIIYRMLRNDLYVGDTRFGRYVSGKFARLEGATVVKTEYGKRPERKTGLLLQGTHEGIIDRELWNRVQEKIKRRGLRRERPRGEGGYALKNLLVCGHCDHVLFGRKDMGKKDSGNVGYYCRNAEQYGYEAGCKGWHVREIDILPFLIARLAEAIDLRVLQSSAVQRPSGDDSEDETVVALEAKVAAFDRKITSAEEFLRVAEECADGLKEQVAEWKSEHGKLKEELEQARRHAPNWAAAMREWQAWFAAMQKRLVEIQTHPARGAKLSAGVTLTPEVFREKMRGLGCRAVIWWKQVGPKRWGVDRVRILMGPGATSVSSGESPKTPETPENAGKAGDTGIVPNGAPTSVGSAFGTPVIDLSFTAKDLYPRAEYAVSLPIMLEMRGKNATYTEIANALSKKGILTSKGKTWTWRNVCRALRNYRTGW